MGEVYRQGPRGEEIEDIKKFEDLGGKGRNRGLTFVIQVGR